MIKSEIETTDIIYNFNYTNSVFRIAEILNINNIESKHSYVHGSIEKSDIIVGVQDNARIHPNHIFFKKSYNINFGESNIGKSLDYYNDLILFGHSLGETDSSYFANYISSLAIDIGYPELKFYYYGEIGYDEMMKTLDKYTRNKLTEFKHYNKFIPINSLEDN